MDHFTETRIFDGCSVRIPDPKRLIAMKLHALKAATRRNRGSDWDDILGVIKANNLDVEEREFKEIVEQYGPSGAIDEIRGRL